VLQPVQRGVERALLNLQRAARDLLDAQQYAVPVQLSERDGLEAQQVQRAGQQLGGIGNGFLSYVG